MNAKTKKPWSLRVAAYLCSALAILNPVYPALADILDDAIIEQDINSNPFYLPEASNDYSFSAPQFVEWPSSGTSSVETVYNQLLKEHPDAISPPTYIPIGVGDITTIIPTYKRYKYLSTPAAQARYVRSQVVSLLGRNLFGYESEFKQLNALFDNAIDYMKTEGSPVYGTPLYYDQVDSGLPTDMIWPELRVINGKEVIVPIVYLTAATVAQYKVVDNQQQAPSDASFGALTVYNSDLKVEREGFLEVAGDIRLSNGASISGQGALKIIAGGQFDNASSVVQANGDLTIGAKSIHNHTIVYRYDLGNEQGTRYGEIASLQSNCDDLIPANCGNVLLQSHGDIQFNGANASASGGAITLQANGNIVIGPQKLFDSTTSRFGSGTQTRSEVSYLQSHITAEDTIKLMAGGQIVIDAAEIVSDSGHIELLARMGVSVIDSVGQYQSQASGKFGKKKIDESVYQTVAIRSNLDAGKGVKLSTEFGDIAIRAADITTTEGASVSAKNGAVKLLMTTETDHYSYSSVKEGLFTTTTVSKGHNSETGVPNTIVGGLAVEALNGVFVEYEGNPNLTTEQQLDKIAAMPGMEWIDDVRNSPDVDWNAIMLAHEEWYEKNTSLSPAFAAVVAIAIAVATQGAGSNLAATIMGSSQAAAGAMGSAIAAGTSSFISQASMAAINGALNGDIAGAMEDFASSDTLKSLAVSMVTAGAIAQVDAAFFNVDTASVAEATEAVETATTLTQAQDGVNAAINTTNAASAGMSLTAQVTQAVTHATVQAGVQSIAYGSDFEDAFVTQLIQSGISTLGQKLTEKIGEAAHQSPPAISDVSRYIAHGAVGCLTGELTAKNESVEDGCVSGASGAVIGELVTEASVKLLKDDLEAWTEKYLDPEKNYTLKEIDDEVKAFKNRGVNLGKLAAGIGAFVANLNVDISAEAAYTAGTFNGSSFEADLRSISRIQNHIQWRASNPTAVLLHDAVSTSGDRLGRAMFGDGIDIYSASFWEEEYKNNPTLSNALSQLAAEGLKNFQDNMDYFVGELRESLSDALSKDSGISGELTADPTSPEFVEFQRKFDVAKYAIQSDLYLIQENTERMLIALADGQESYAEYLAGYVRDKQTHLSEQMSSLNKLVVEANQGGVIYPGGTGDQLPITTRTEYPLTVSEITTLIFPADLEVAPPSTGYNDDVEVVNTWVLENPAIDPPRLDDFIYLSVKNEGEGLTGQGDWKYGVSSGDRDLRNDPQSTWLDGVDKAFDEIERTTGIKRNEFTPSLAAFTENGKTMVVEWTHPSGASVNLDIPALQGRYSKATREWIPAAGPHQPHVGYTNGVKGAGKLKGHIFVSGEIPATRTGKEETELFTGAN